MKTPTEYLSEASSITENFRKQIRRRDIESRFAERRRQMMEQRLPPYTKDSVSGWGKEDEENKLKGLPQTVNQIQKQFLKSGKILPQWLETLGLASEKLQGAYIVAKISSNFFIDMFENFVIPEQCSDKKPQQTALLILNNILTLAPNPLNSCPPTLQSLPQIVNILSMPMQMQKLFSLVHKSQKSQIKSYTLGILFSILYVSDLSVLQYLLACSKSQPNIIDFLYSLFYTQPSQAQLIESLRIYYILLKRLDWPHCEKVAKVRKLITASLRNCGGFQLLLIGVMCLQALLRCLPAQKSNTENQHILELVLQKSLQYNNDNLNIHVLNLGSMCLCPQVISFVDTVLGKEAPDNVKVVALKVVYEWLMGGASDLKQHISLLQKIHQIFYSNGHNVSVYIEASLCMALLAIKSKGEILTEEIIKVKARVQEIMMIPNINEDDIKSLSMAQAILEDGCCFGEI